MKKVFMTSDIDAYNNTFNLLGLEEVKRHHIPLSKLSLVTYRKVKEVKDYQSLKDRYMPNSTIPFAVVIFFIIIAVALATTYLILNFTIDNFDKLTYFYALMLPTSIATLVATGISFYRYYVELKNVEKVAAVLLLKKEVLKNEDGSGRQE